MHSKIPRDPYIGLGIPKRTPTGLLLFILLRRLSLGMVPLQFPTFLNVQRQNRETVRARFGKDNTIEGAIGVLAKDFGERVPRIQCLGIQQTVHGRGMSWR